MKCETPRNDRVGTVKPKSRCLKGRSQWPPEVTTEHSLDLDSYFVILDLEPVVVENLRKLFVGRKLTRKHNAFWLSGKPM